MKASELTIPGFYWYRLSGEWTVVEFDADGEWAFSHIGTDESFKADDFPGEFIGPIAPPASAPA